MDNQTENNGLQTNRPVLRKVKRPINRMHPQAPAAVSDNTNTATLAANQSSVTPQNTNPFRQTSGTTSDRTPAFSDETFNLDDYLDNQNLPAVNNTPTNYQEQPQFITDEDLAEEAQADEVSGVLPSFLNTKILAAVGVAIFLVGLIAGRLFFAEQKVVRNGLQGVVINPEVPRGRARCGIAEKTQGCVLYIMNPQRQELNARDFYDLASQLTGRQRFVIETGNMRYSGTKIRPGDIVQLNIPPL